MISDDQNLLDLHVSHYYVHVSGPQRIIQLSEENRSSESMSFHASSKIKHLCDDSLDMMSHHMEIENVDSMVQSNSIHSMNLLNNMHPQVRQFIKSNFGMSGLELIPVELFTNYLINEFETMFNYSDIEGIRVKLLDYLKIRMGGSFIDIERLLNVTKLNGLIGFVSGFMATMEFQTVQTQVPQQKTIKQLVTQNTLKDSTAQTKNIESIVKSFAQKLFLTLQKEMEMKLNHQMDRISDKYNVALTMLYKIEKKTETMENRRRKAQIEELKLKIIQLETQTKNTETQLLVLKQTNQKLGAENTRQQEKIEKLNDHIKALEGTRYPSIPHAIPSPSNHNTSFDKSRLEQIFISTPKSQKSGLLLIPEIPKGRSLSSCNLELNLTCLSARDNPQQSNSHRRLKTEEETGRAETARENRNQSIKKNSQMIHPKNRPVKVGMKKSTWKV